LEELLTKLDSGFKLFTKLHRSSYAVQSLTADEENIGMRIKGSELAPLNLNCQLNSNGYYRWVSGWQLSPTNWLVGLNLVREKACAIQVMVHG